MTTHKKLGYWANTLCSRINSLGVISVLSFHTFYNDFEEECKFNFEWNRTKEIPTCLLNMISSPFTAVKSFYEVM